MNQPKQPEFLRAVGEVREVRLRRILDTYLDFVGRTLRSYGVNEVDVDDSVQQVCIVLAEKLDYIEPLSERAFLFRTTQRIASRTRRTRSRRHEVPDDDASEVADPLDPDRIADARQAFDVLSRVLDSLADDLREVFVLYELEELTMAVIAETLDIPPGTVASRLRRAREQFQASSLKLRRKTGGGT